MLSLTGRDDGRSELGQRGAYGDDRQANDEIAVSGKEWGRLLREHGLTSGPKRVGGALVWGWIGIVPLTASPDEGGAQEPPGEGVDF